MAIDLTGSNKDNSIRASKTGEDNNEASIDDVNNCNNALFQITTD